MVVSFDGIEVQMPTDGNRDCVIYVKCIDARYSLSSKEEFEKELASDKKAKVRPKTEEKSSDEIN